MTIALQKYANGPNAQTAASMSSSDTVMGMASLTGYPSTPEFTIKVDNELLLVTAINSGTLTFTVVRGQEGTTAASHVSGSFVYMPLTAYSLRQLVAIALDGTIVGRRRLLNFSGVTLSDDPTNDKIDITISGGGGGGGSSLEAPVTKPLLSQTTWLNQQNATAANLGNGIAMSCGASGTAGARCLFFPITGSSPWTATMRLQPQGPQGPVFGPIVRNSSSGNMVRYPWYFYSNDLRFGFDQGSSPTSFSYQDYVATNLVTNQWWIKFVDNGSTRKVYLSADGYNWVQHYSSSTNSYTGAPDQVGFCIEPTSDRDFGVSCLSFTTSNP